MFEIRKEKTLKKEEGSFRIVKSEKEIFWKKERKF